MKKILIILCLLIWGSHGAGIVISNDPGTPDPVLLNHYVNATIDDTVADVWLSQEFRNVGERDMLGTYVFPMPQEGINDYTLDIDGQTYSAQTRNASDALDEFQAFIIERKDASLVSLVDQGTLESSIFLPVNKTVRISMHYKQPVKRNAGMGFFSYPLNPGRYSVTPIDPVNITIRVISSGNLSAIHSPTHPVDINRISDNESVISYYESEAIPTKDFLLLYGSASSGNDVKLLTHREKGEEGHFMLFLYPTANESIPKDVVFLIDTSGSMSGKKIEQAKSALRHSLSALNENDRFNIISFSDQMGGFSEKLEDQSRISDAMAYVDSLSANGATDLYTPQIEAVDMLGENSGRARIVVFLTDGQDTTGHSTEYIIDELQKKRNGWRIYPFGLGRDLDFGLISKEANEFGDGVPVYVESEADLESALSDFSSRISVAAVEGAELDMGGFAYEVYPSKIDNLYAHNTVIVCGKYNVSGNATIRLSGMVGNETKYWFYNAILPEESDNPFVERSWAVRKIGYLMDQINLEGETESLRDEVAYLGNKYALATPYTSLLVKAQEEFEEAKKSGLVSNSLSSSDYDIIFLDLEAHGSETSAIIGITDQSGSIIDKLSIREGESVQWVSPQGEVFDIFVGKVAPGYTFGAKWADVSVLDLQANSKASGILNQGQTVNGASFTAASAFESGSVQAQSAFALLGTKEIDGKTFVDMQGTWLDTACSGNETVEDVEFGSAEYLGMLRDNGISSYLAAGSDMVLCLGNRSIRIYSNDSEAVPTEVLMNATGLEKKRMPSPIDTIGPSSSDNASAIMQDLPGSSIGEGIKTGEADNNAQRNLLDMIIDFIMDLLKVV